MSDSVIPASIIVVIVGLVGAMVGSFLNVVIHRVPAGLSVVRPGSSCPDCGAPVRARDNIPVVSWLVLRGRCRDCGAPISPRYPLVELATAALFAVSALQFDSAPHLVAVLFVVAAGVAQFMIDLEHRRLPFAITGVAAVGAVVALGIAAATGQADHVVTAVLSSGLWLAVYGGIWLLTTGRGMGLGDVALAPLLGLVLGWSGWGPSLVGLLSGFVVGAVVGVVLLSLSRASAKSRVPHGPFLLTGAAIGLWVGEPLWQEYLGAFGLA